MPRTWTSTSPGRVAWRVGVISTIGVAVAVCLWSWLLSAIVGVLTIIAVVVDVMTRARGEDPSLVVDPTPQKITVDLSRRS